ncbi:LysR substrate-binding domain-containing protein (plasmid) [Variovorax sp. 375MFSha3.1]|uniref:LysR substrate-binding domain-containing protein n=1 Tax=unclassified Variovorax TaxID=663243 RepID=UPI003AADE642
MSELHSFVVAVRTGSFSRAAVELCVTQGAISRAVARLETHYGKPLLQRNSRQLKLTEAGQQFFDSIWEPLAAIESASTLLRQGAGGDSQMSISVVTSLAGPWLIPRLSDFWQKHPTVQLKFVPYRMSEEFDAPAPDCCIHFGLGPEQWPEWSCDYVIGRELVVICSPLRAEARYAQGRWKDLRELADEPLLFHTSAPDRWRLWLHEVCGGLSTVNLTQGYDLVATLVQAAIADYGVAIVPRCIVQWELTSGRLVAPFDVPVMVARGYFLCAPMNRVRLPAFVAFRSWLLDIAAADRATYPV